MVELSRWLAFSLIFLVWTVDRTLGVGVIQDDFFGRAAVQDTNKSSLTQGDRDEFLAQHNAFRGGVNPAANNMKKMEWNADLESMAQEWADRCMWEHGQPTRDSYPFQSIGQNNWAGSGGYDVSGSVTSWYNEVDFYSYNCGGCAAGKVCGHYTQVVWANSYALGCGITYCPGFLNWNPGGYFIVCNYGPAGNYNGAKPYESGTSCSSCESGWNTCESGLCASTPAALTGERSSTDDGNNTAIRDTRSNTLVIRTGRTTGGMCSSSESYKVSSAVIMLSTILAAMTI